MIHPRRIRAGAVLLSAMVLAGMSAAPGAAQDDDTPGVYVEEVPDSGAVTAEDMSVTLMVGAGTPVAPNTADAEIVVQSAAEFPSLVSAPSAALLAGVQQYFANGGTSLVVLTTTGEDPAVLSAAVGRVASLDSGAELLVVPALGSLDASGWTQVASAMVDAMVDQQGTALLDPPGALVQQAVEESSMEPLTSLADQVRDTLKDPGRAMLYSGGLRTADGASVAAAPVMAGVIGTVDSQEGVWIDPAGSQAPVKGLDPVLSIGNQDNAELNDAGIAAWRVIPGYGTVMWGARTLASTGNNEYLATQRTLSMIQLSVSAWLRSELFDSNDEETWGVVERTVSAFLTELWNEGALLGAAASDAYSVEVGLGSTMTAQDVAEGLMVVEIDVAVEEPAEKLGINITQEMQSSG